LGARSEEVVASSIRLDVVEAHDDDRELLEDRTSGRQAALQTSGGRREYEGGVQVELLRKLRLPLLSEVWRTQHRQSLRITLIEELADDQAGLDRLADADVV